MRTLIVIILLAVYVSGFGQYKINYNDTLRLSTICLKEEPKSGWDNIMWAGIGIAGYATFDYIGYNTLGKSNEGQYRFLQGLVFGTINWLLGKFVSVKSAMSFSIWTLGGLPDLGYYGYDKLFGHQGGFSNGNEFAINKYYSHLTFIPTCWGQEKAHGVDLLVNTILATGIIFVINL